MKVEIIDWDNNNIVVEDVKSFKDRGDNVSIKFVINGKLCEYTYAYKTFSVVSAPPAYRAEKAPEDNVILDGSEPEEQHYLTTVVISSGRAGHCMQALARIRELAFASSRVLAFTKLYDDVYLDRFEKFPRGISPNRGSGRFHQFTLKSNYTLDELNRILDPLNFPEYSNHSQLTMVDISL